jgi:choline-sulfatase
MPRPKRPPSPASPSASRTWRWAALLAVLIIIVTAGTTLWLTRTRPLPEAARLRPNVLLITLDTTRADRIGAYGYTTASTPHLDRLAASGVRFEHALSPAPLTLPAHASLMTGRQPYAHGVRNNGYFVLSPEMPTLAETFASAGYDTAAFVSAFVLDRQFGLSQGFAHYDDSLDRTSGTASSSLELERRGDRTVEAATRWLSTRATGRPFFAWVHLFDPHDPYAPPSPFREQFADRPYDGEIAFTDALVGTLLERVGYGKSPTFVVVAGDHGESLGEHGESTHGLFVYDAALRVPLIIAGEGISGPSILSEPVRLIDVAPTIADLVGIDILPDVEGRSLRSLMTRSTTAEEPPAIYAETYFPQFFMGWAPLRSLRAGRWKFIDAPEPELYDVEADPAERTNVIVRETARAESLRRALASTLASHANTSTPTPMSDDARQRLASLGYVSVGSAPAENTPTRGADPKHMVPLFEQLIVGNRALATGDADIAARIARDVLQKDPTNAFARLLQGRAFLAQDRNGEAMAAFAEYLSLVPQSADAHHWTALAALRLGDRERALAEEEAAVALDPRHTSALALRAGLLFSTGRGDEGIASLRDAVQRDPSNHALTIELADLLADAQQYGDAETQYRQVLTAQPSNSRALTGLGMVLASTGRLDEALDTLTEAITIDPRDEETRLARAEVLAGLGRADAARAEFEQLSRTAARPDIREAARRAARRR